LLLLVVAPWAGLSPVVLDCLALLLLGSSGCCAFWDRVSGSDDANRREFDVNDGYVADMELGEGLVMLEVDGAGAAVPERRASVVIDAGIRLMAIGEVLVWSKQIFDSEVCES